MPVMHCVLNGKPGYKYGPNGKCYTYTTEAGRKRAKTLAIKQGYAIDKGKDL